MRILTNSDEQCTQEKGVRTVQDDLFLHVQAPTEHCQRQVSPCCLSSCYQQSCEPVSFACHGAQSIPLYSAKMGTLLTGTACHFKFSRPSLTLLLLFFFFFFFCLLLQVLTQLLRSTKCLCPDDIERCGRRGRALTSAQAAADRDTDQIP